MIRVALPAALRAQILDEAGATAPRECCGLLEGTRGDVFTISALHPAKNLSPLEDRFEIDPADQFAAQRAARANGHTMIGCYHSHPEGQAIPSARDKKGAEYENFLWLIAAGESVAAFVYSDGEFVGADWVTSSE